MQVFKVYFKIIRRHIGAIMIYFTVFLGVSLLITSMMGSNGTANFKVSKANVAILNEDSFSALSLGLQDYLTENAHIVKIPDNSQDIQDSLFYGNVDYVLKIPAGFGQGFLSGSSAVELQKTAASGSTSAIFMDFVVNRYLNMAKLYSSNATGLTDAQIVSSVQKDLANQAKVVLDEDRNAVETNNLSYYFRYLAYCIMAVTMLGVTSFMMALNETDLNNRNLCSPVKPLNMSMQIALGNTVFAAVVWAAMCVVVFLMYGSVPIGAGTLLLCLNALVLTIVCISMGFLAGKFVRNSAVQSAITNVVSLGFSFIGGVFVEQNLLGSTVLNIARFTPAYWYVKAVDGIRSISDFTLNNLQPVIQSMLVQLGFAVAIFLVALMLAKYIRPAKEI